MLPSLYVYFKEVDFPGSLFSSLSVTADGVVIDSITLDDGLCLGLSKVITLKSTYCAVETNEKSNLLTTSIDNHRFS